NCGIENRNEREQRRKLDEERAQAIEKDFPDFLEEWKALPLFQSPYKQENKQLAQYHFIQARQNPQQMARSLRGFGAGQIPSVKNQLAQLSLQSLIMAGAYD